MKITAAAIAGLIILSTVLGFMVRLMWRSLKRSDDPGRLISKWVISGVLIGIGVSVCFGSSNLGSAAGFIMPITVMVCGVGLGLIWAPNLATIIASPLTNAIDGGDQEIEPQPLYSMAQAKRKQGKYMESIAEIRKQLARFPEDFQGWIMLAEIQAEDLHDQAAALDTIDRFLTQPDHAPKNIAYALNRAADWHLKFGQDPESARQTLERILELLPETEEAQTARQRIAHLATPKELAEKHERAPIALPHHEEHLGLREDFSGLRPAPEDPAKLAQDYVRHLEDYPNDNEAREKLALVYADHYQRLDLATDQLEQLIAVSHQQPKQIVHWLNLLADLQVKLTGDATLARQTLQRIVDTNPKSAAAENARHRIAYLKLELKPQQKSQAMKLGSYEENLGLADKKPSAGDAGQSAYRSR
jgi:tetratricopeptide (TPR) repeat protein